MAGQQMRSFEMTEITHRALAVCLEVPVMGLDVVEVAPPYDHADITAALANRVVLEGLSAIARRRYDAQHGSRWDPGTPLLDGREASVPQGPMRGHQH